MRHPQRSPSPLAGFAGWRGVATRPALAMAVVTAFVSAACSGGDGVDAPVPTDAPTVTGDVVDDEAVAATDGSTPTSVESGDVGGETGVVDDGGSVDADHGVLTPSVPAEHFLANVTTADGFPVPWAIVEGWTGDEYGQVVGTAAPLGWYEVDAAGFAPTFARAVVTLGGVDLLDVELTPDGPGTVVGDEPAELAVGVGVDVVVPAGSLPAGTWLTVTEVPARYLTAPSAPVDGGYRTRIFSFESVGPDGSVVQPTAPLTLRVDDTGELGAVTRWATFDPVAGAWTGGGACVAVGAGVECDVDHFSMMTLIGDQPHSEPRDDGPDADADAEEQAAREAQEQAEQMLADLEEAQEQAEQTLADFEEAQEQAEQMLADLEEATEQAGERASERLDGATDAARSGTSRIAKDRLLTAIAVAEMYDVDTTAGRAALVDAYARIAEEAVQAASAAERPRCEHIPRLAAVLAEGALIAAIGENPRGHEAVRDLIGEIEIECRTSWSGTIEYRFPAPARWEIYSLITPGPGALYQDRGGVSEWTETAFVRIAVDPDSGQLQGSVTTATHFVPLRFRLDTTPDADPCGGDHWQEFLVEGIGSAEGGVNSDDGIEATIRRSMSSTGMFNLSFDGFYEAPHFVVSAPRIVSDPGIRIQTQHDGVTWIVPCERIDWSTVDEDYVVEPYTTQLLDGFGFLSPVTPRVTLQEMLDAPARQEDDGRIVIEGRRQLIVDLDLIVPFASGEVSWRFANQMEFGEFEF